MRNAFRKDRIYFFILWLLKNERNISRDTNATVDRAHDAKNQVVI